MNNAGTYSTPRVMRSNAGWYIGTVYQDAEGFEEPGSRLSGYFGSAAAAEAALPSYADPADGEFEIAA